MLNLKFNDDLFITCSKDKTIKIWNMKTYQIIRTLHGHRASVNALLLHENNFVISASGDR